MDLRWLLCSVTVSGLAGPACTSDEARRPSDDPTGPVVPTSTAATGQMPETDGSGTEGSDTQSTAGDETSGETTGGTVEPRPPGTLTQVCFELQDPHPWNGATPQFVADLTDNGVADTMTVSGPDGSASARVSVGRSGAGRWQEHVDTALDGSTDVRLADVDGDGSMEVLSVGASLVTFYGETDGALTRAPESLPLEGFTSVALLDFDNDGQVDVWLSTYDGRLEAYRGAGNGAFSLANTTQLADALDGTELYPGGSGLASLGVMMGAAAGCLDCDSSAFSLLALGTTGEVAALGVVEFEAQWKLIAPTVASVYDGDRPEVFVDFGIEQRSVFGGEGALSIVGFLPNGATAFGDINGDGAAELLLLQDDTVHVYADGPQEVTPVLTRDALDVPELAVADADGDGWDDVVLIDPVGYNTETGQLEPAITVMLSRPCPG